MRASKNFLAKLEEEQKEEEKEKNIKKKKEAGREEPGGTSTRTRAPSTARSRACQSSLGG